MSTRHVTIGDRHYVVERAEDGTIRVNGTRVDAHFNQRDHGRFDLRIDTSIFDVEIVRRDGEGLVEFMMNGTFVCAQVDDEASLLLKKLSHGKSRRAQSAHVKAPMPGKIVKVLVSEGDLVEAGHGVVILEAMKMENEIRTTVAGTIKAIKVRETDAVEKNAILIEIE
jgi:acetyl/propionyl-CoA carboxylase alpha subunit